MPQKPSQRDYKAEYSRYQGTKQQKLNRAARNAARAKMKKAGHNVDGKDVGHVKPLASGGTNASGNLAVQSIKQNRGYKRDKRNKPL